MSTEELARLAKEIPLLTDRLHHEYNKYFSGGEKKPPILLREQLEKLVEKARATMRQAQGVSLSFQLQNAVAKFNTHKALWDKKMLEREGT